MTWQAQAKSDYTGKSSLTSLNLQKQCRTRCDTISKAASVMLTGRLERTCRYKAVIKCGSIPTGAIFDAGMTSG